jgi:hypothetical protein
VSELLTTSERLGLSDESWSYTRLDTRVEKDVRNERKCSELEAIIACRVSIYPQASADGKSTFGLSRQDRFAF